MIAVVGFLGLSIVLEPINNSTLHDLARRVSQNININIAYEPRYRQCIAVDKTKLKVKKAWYMMVC